MSTTATSPTARRRRVVVGYADSPADDERPGFANVVSLRVQPELVLALREALVFAPGIKAAFVYGPAARGEERPASDIDLMVIGEASYVDCFAGLLDAEKVLKRQIRARFVSAEEWLARGSAFFVKVAAGPRIFIFRSADSFRW